VERPAEFYPGGVTLIVPLADGAVRGCMCEVISPDGALQTITEFVLHVNAEDLMWAEITKLSQDDPAGERIRSACLVTAVQVYG